MILGLRAHVTACLVAALALLAGPLRAHPHVFIDAGLTLIRDDDGRIAEVEVTWLYDELYTLILLQDYGLDPDYDLVLTEAEIDATLGFDLNWNSGFEGGLRLFRGVQELQIGTPAPVSLRLHPDGRLQSTHRRPVIGDPGGADPIEAQVYDPAFFIAFEAIGEMAVTGGGPCSDELVRADLDAAYAALEVEIAAIGGAVAAEDNFPAVGALFADRVVFTCTE